eukprot:7113419-Alexandrium_andersonii.AAC.1
MGRFGIYAKNGAERTSQELGEPHFEAAPGPAQFQVRTHEAILHVLHVLHGDLRIEADCSAGGPWADCGLRFGHLAM